MSGKRARAGWEKLLRSILSLSVLLLLMGGSILGLYLYVDHLVSQMEREGFSTKDLKAPITEERSLGTEKPPIYIQPWEPGLSPDVHLIIALNNSDSIKKLDGYPHIGVILNLSLVNSGTNRIYVERAYAHPGWGGEVSGDLKKYMDIGQERYMRHMIVPLPEELPGDDKLTLSVFFDILVERGNTWYRREGIEFPPYPVNILEPRNTTFEPRLRTNPAYFYDRINNLVEKDREPIRSLVENSTLGQGNYTIQKVVDAYEFVRGSLDYIPDPDTGRNEWISPITCLEKGGGDCEDFSILLGSIISAMGGNARVIITSGHAFNAVYLGEDDSILEAVNDRYGLQVPFQIWEDKLGKWLIIEPQSQLVFGWFPLDVGPVWGPVDGMYIPGYDGLSWGFVGSEEISIVDIYYK
ncbi:MAG: transglutaminase family protein [Candidatus Thermoplasmatota archaeon]|nr:transglutaminase family protein [Candidatus Thermoplasmatota archaeon]